ncbi:hypothetical protein JCM10296v2_005969 [Rhodotorula toruloides]
MRVLALLLFFLSPQAQPVPLEPPAQLVLSPDATLDVDTASAQRARPAYFDVRDRGGSMLNRNRWKAGEPLNVIVSAQSSPRVLSESGFIAYSRSLGLWNECVNLHFGDPQEANLGDGKGWEQELFVMRESVWPFPIVGACLESVTGGNHFRAYRQNGTEANSGAWFLAASKELDLRGKHKIIPNGYNIGRDWIVEQAVRGTWYLNRRYSAQVEWLDGLLEPGNKGIAHGIAQDGRVALLTVRQY